MPTEPVTLRYSGETYYAEKIDAPNYLDARVIVGELVEDDSFRACVAHIDREDGMVIESFDGQVVHFSPYKCGYLGTAPGETAKALVRLGFGEFEDVYRQVATENAVHMRRS